MIVNMQPSGIWGWSWEIATASMRLASRSRGRPRWSLTCNGRYVAVLGNIGEEKAMYPVSCPQLFRHPLIRNKHFKRVANFTTP